MKIQKTLLLVLIAGLSTTLFAQKIKKEGLGSYKYTQLPSSTILVEMNTYKVDAKGMHGDSYRRDAIAGNISLAGFERTSTREEADFIVEVEEYPLRWGEYERKSETKTVKKDGVESKVTTYSYVNKCNYKYVLRVFNNAGESLFSKTIEGEESISGGSDASTSNAFESYKSAKSKFSSDVIGNKVSSLNATVNDIYCFPVKSYGVDVGVVKPKKHDYPAINGALSTMQAGFEIIAADENAIEEAAAKFNEAITVYTNALQKADPENKKAKINEDVTAMLYYNIALAHFLMKDYPMAIDNLNKAIEIKSGIYDGKYLLRLAEDLQKRTEANNV